jgi:methylmalonyl-CoA/ethylmalonyl-CoA epimerase
MALAVNDIAESTAALAACGFTPYPEFPDTTDEGIGVHLRFLVPRGGGPLLELVAGIGAQSPVSKVLEKTGVTLYHMCFEVPDLDVAAKQLRAHGYLVVSKKIPAKAFNSRPIQFLYHVHAGLVELLQAAPVE